LKGKKTSIEKAKKEQQKERLRKLKGTREIVKNKNEETLVAGKTRRGEVEAVKGEAVKGGVVKMEMMDMNSM